MKKSTYIGLGMLLASPIFLYSSYKIIQHNKNKCEELTRNPAISRTIQLENRLAEINRIENLSIKLQNFQNHTTEINEYNYLIKREDIGKAMRYHNDYCNSVIPLDILPFSILGALGLGLIPLGIGNILHLYNKK